MKDNNAPRPISKEARVIDLTNYLMPVDKNGQPTFLHMPGAGEDLFLPTFTSESALEIFKQTPGVPPFDNIFRITNGREFMDSIPLHIRIIVDLRPHDDPEKKSRGCTRFTEIWER